MPDRWFLCNPGLGADKRVVVKAQTAYYAWNAVAAYCGVSPQRVGVDEIFDKEPPGLTLWIECGKKGGWKVMPGPQQSPPPDPPAEETEHPESPLER